MPYILITAGNKNIETFENVCHAVNHTFSVDVIYIFDTLESEKIAIESSRTSKIREILGKNVEIRTRRVGESDLQTIIPSSMSKLLQEFKPEDIIVDLTNGQKITASVLYSVAAIARVKQIYSLEMKINPRTLSKETRLPDLTHLKDWDYVSIEPLREIHHIARSSQVELVYYRDRINDACESISKKNATLAKDFQRSLHNVLVHYFAVTANDGLDSLERLEDCIAGLGKVCESISKIAYSTYQRIDKTTPADKDFRSRVDFLKPRWDWGHKKISGLEIKKERDYALPEDYVQTIIKPTLTIGAILESVILYRNLAAHPGKPYSFTLDDARFVLSATLLLLEQIGRSNMLLEKEVEE